MSSRAQSGIIPSVLIVRGGSIIVCNLTGSSFSSFLTTGSFTPEFPGSVNFCGVTKLTNFTSLDEARLDEDGDFLRLLALLFINRGFVVASELF
jgi:hypothetical protein